MEALHRCPWGINSFRLPLDVEESLHLLDCKIQPNLQQMVAYVQFYNIVIVMDVESEFEVRGQTSSADDLFSLCWSCSDVVGSEEVDEDDFLPPSHIFRERQKSATKIKGLMSTGVFRFERVRKTFSSSK